MIGARADDSSATDGRNAVEREQRESLRRILLRMGVANFEVLRRAEEIAKKARKP